MALILCLFLTIIQSFECNLYITIKIQKGCLTQNPKQPMLAISKTKTHKTVSLSNQNLQIYWSFIPCICVGSHSLYIMTDACFVCLFCCFTSQVNSYGHCGTVSPPNHTFSWADFNKRLTSNLCIYFRL